jgi:hypothetical protein
MNVKKQCAGETTSGSAPAWFFDNLSVFRGIYRVFTNTGMWWEPAMCRHSFHHASFARRGWRNACVQTGFLTDSICETALTELFRVDLPDLGWARRRCRAHYQVCVEDASGIRSLACPQHAGKEIDGHSSRLIAACGDAGKRGVGGGPKNVIAADNTEISRYDDSLLG